MLLDLKPKSEPERQIAQKIIDTNFRLNRLTAIENNMFSFGLIHNEANTDHDDRIESWPLRPAPGSSAPTSVRKEQERIGSTRSRDEIKRMSSTQLRLATLLRPLLKGLRFLHYPEPPSPSKPCTTGDLVTGPPPSLPSLRPSSLRTANFRYPIGSLNAFKQDAD